MRSSAAALLCALAWCGLACGPARVVPSADLSESLPAQSAMTKLRERWESLDYQSLRSLEP
ncbi:MAG: hypothetical protein JNK04_14175, partial [Myxococcales bacterium]|nr:hypothetical protein [Myxococcales bacterium]